MQEVEILVEILEDKEAVLKKLKQFNFVGDKKVLDVYFVDSKRDDLKPDKTGRLNNCFRLRKKNDKNYLAFKKDYFVNNIWTHSDEHEVEVNDFETMMEIIQHLGFEILVEIENNKSTFLTDKYEIVFEDVKNLGLFLEVERLEVDENEKVEEVKKEIWEFIKSLNIKTSQELNAGKPELMLNKK